MAMPRSVMALQTFDRWLNLVDLISRLPATPPRPGVPSGTLAPFLASAEPIWIAPEMADLAQVAAQTFPPAPIQESQAFSLRGFAWFERQMSGSVEIGDRDRQPRQDLFHGMYWFIHPRPFPDANGPHLAVGTISTVEDMEAMNERRDMPGRWNFVPGAPYFAPIGTDFDFNPTKIITLNLLRSLWVLCNQRIATTTRERVGRSATKRATRMQVPHIPDVSVITLRRQHAKANGNDDDSGFVEWSHRWIVGGHWRNQWLPSEQRHEPRWIAPYIKGPENKPLVADRVYELVR